MTVPRRSVGRKLLLISLPTLALVLVFFEFGVFRIFVAVDTTPLVAYDPAYQIVKYRPDQAGIRYPDRDRRHPVAYSINKDGWNSFHAGYPARRNGRRRVAIIGDSYVEAFQVNPDESVGARLEARLGSTRAEVFSFGISGAPLTQYLHMARYVTRAFSPDVVVIVIVHNDFTESYLPKPERYASSFLHIEVGDAIREIAPQPYLPLPPLAQWLLVRSATARAGFYAWRVLEERTSRTENQNVPIGRVEANVDVGLVNEEDPRIRRATRYVFDQLAVLERASSCRILLVMDSPREAIYLGRSPETLDVYRLNRIAAETAEAIGLPFLDLTGAFVDDYARSGSRFEFETDSHWNVRAHELVASQIATRVDSILTERGDARSVATTRGRAK